MTKGYLYCYRKSATAAQLLSQLAALTDDWNLPAYRYQERLDDVELDWADAVWAERLATGTAILWPVGRVFCPAGEVRWEATENGYAVQVVTENDLGLPETEWERTTFEQVDEEQSYFLWGECRQEGRPWVEMRIPRPLCYPAKWSQEQTMVATQGKTYQQHGIVRLMRLTGVKALPNPREEVEQ